MVFAYAEANLGRSRALPFALGLVCDRHRSYRASHSHLSSLRNSLCQVTGRWRESVELWAITNNDAVNLAFRFRAGNFQR